MKGILLTLFLVVFLAPGAGDAAPPATKARSTGSDATPSPLVPYDRTKTQAVFEDALRVHPLMNESFLLYFQFNANDLTEKSNNLIGEEMTIIYHGEGNLLIPTADDVAEPRNRRVEVMVR
jgi:hypothetical protein